MAESTALDYLEQAARSAVTVPETEFTRLGEERALAIERALLTDTGLEPTRVFKSRDGKVAANEGKVRFELGLE
jgi:hypothetical protein